MTATKVIQRQRRGTGGLPEACACPPRRADKAGGKMDDITSFGAWLKRRRQTLGLTQDALAQQVGCAVATIRKIEADARRPSVQIAERLADVLAPQDRAAFLHAARA